MRTKLYAATLVLPLCTQAQFTIYNEDNSEIAGNYTGALAPSATGIWVGTLNGLNHFDGSAWTLWTAENSELPHNTITDFAVDEAGDLWMWNYDQGCSRFDGTSFEVWNTGNGLPANVGSNVMVLGGVVYAGTYYGLSAFQGTDWVTTDTDNSGLPDDDVRDCAIDSDGHLWVPTLGGGVAFYDGDWTVFNTANSDLPDDEVFVARVRSDGHVFLGTRYGGLVEIIEGAFTIYNMENSILGSNDIRNIEFGNGGETIVCTRDAGFYVIQPDGTWTSYTTANTNLPSDITTECMTDADGNLWVATSLGLVTIADWTVQAAVGADMAFPDARVNITDGQLNVSLSEGSARIEVLDQLGRSIWTSPLAVRSLQHDLSGLAVGAYNVRLTSGPMQRTWKLLLTR